MTDERTNFEFRTYTVPFSLIIIRVVNPVKLFSSYFLSLFLHKPTPWGYPVHVSIEPTNHCNLRCPECPTGQRGLTRPVGTLPFTDFKRYIDPLIPQLSWLTLYFQGEPYLNRELFDMISYARSKKIFVWTSSNGHFLTEENIRKTIDSGLNKLVISLDGTDQEAYGQYRVGGSFETVLEGIRSFIRIRKEKGVRYPKLEIQFLALKSNQHQVKEIKRLGTLLGTDRTVVKTAQFYNFEYGNPLMPEEGKLSRYRRTSRQVGKGSTRHQFKTKNPLRNRCFRMWSGCVITWDGKVVPCCFDKDAGHCLGDLNIQSFEDIWFGEPYRQFRYAILTNRKSLEICRNCSQRW